MIVCATCGKSFGTKFNLNRHIRLVHKEFKCGICSESFTDRTSLTNHANTHQFPCDFCKKTFGLKQSLSRHLNSCKEKQKRDAVDEVQPTTSAVEQILCDICLERYNKRTFSSHLRSNKHIENALRQVDEIAMSINRL